MDKEDVVGYKIFGSYMFFPLIKKMFFQEFCFWEDGVDRLFPILFPILV